MLADYSGAEGSGGAAGPHNPAQGRDVPAAAEIRDRGVNFTQLARSDGSASIYSTE